MVIADPLAALESIVMEKTGRDMGRARAMRLNGSNEENAMFNFGLKSVVLRDGWSYGNQWFAITFIDDSVAYFRRQNLRDQWTSANRSVNP